MKLYLIVVLAMAALTIGEVDEQLQAAYQKMDRLEFMEIFNKMNKTWTMKKYHESEHNFGYLLHENTLRTNIFIPYTPPKFIRNLPDNFDARKAWPNCPTVSEIYNQASCNSCWAHGVANTASDRICIHNQIVVELSEQDLECSHVNRTICQGGDSIMGFMFWKTNGLVTKQCKPYQPHNLYREICELRCQYPFRSYKHDKYFAKEIYAIPSNDYQIRAELYLNGPIQASMPVYEDFDDGQGHGYFSGIYEHTIGKFKGYHSVRVIGYGVENGVDYWLVANSWGKDWGENGLFRIKRFQKQMIYNGTNFESRMCTGLPEKRGYY